MPSVFARLSEALADRYALDRELGEGGMARPMWRTLPSATSSASAPTEQPETESPNT